MAKLDYTNSDLKNRYKSLVTDPSSDLTKITVPASEKRTRAELLDILEELFESDELVFNTSFQEKFKATLHIMIKSIDNTLDDDIGTAVAANTSKVGFATAMPTATANHTVALSVVNSRGAYSLVFTMVDSSGSTPVTKTATIALR